MIEEGFRQQEEPLPLCSPTFAYVKITAKRQLALITNIYPQFATEQGAKRKTWLFSRF